MKKVLIAVMVVVLFVTSVMFAADQLVQAKLKNIKVVLNGNTLELKDATGAKVMPLSYKDTTYLPVRAISENMGLTVGWEQETQTITLTNSSVEGNKPDNKPSGAGAYHMGETWTVPGGWELRIDSVEEMTERNQFSDKNPAAVYLVTYTYKNLGYSNNITNGLFFKPDQTIVDHAGYMGYSYPLITTYPPKITPIGATCKAQVVIGVDHAGSFALHVTMTDSKTLNGKAEFLVEVK